MFALPLVLLLLTPADGPELLSFLAIVAGIYLYALRAGINRTIESALARDSDPAPLLYPVVLPPLIALTLAPSGTTDLVSANIVLAIATIPRTLVPLCGTPLHSFLALLPAAAVNHPAREPLALLYPLYHSLFSILNSLFTTSLLPAEVQLLSTALINLLVHAREPPGVILQTLLWRGGVLGLLFCRPVLSWSVTLAHVPSWKFRRPSTSMPMAETPATATSSTSAASAVAMAADVDQRLCDVLCHYFAPSPVNSSDDSGSNDNDNGSGTGNGSGDPGHHSNECFFIRSTSTSTRTRYPRGRSCSPSAPLSPTRSISARSTRSGRSIRSASYSHSSGCNNQTHIYLHHPQPRTTLRGRRRRILSPSLHPFLALTQCQAAVRRWAYALYAYAATFVIILWPVRAYIQMHALDGIDPFGWAMSYMFGNIETVRFWMVTTRLGNWAPLPSRHGDYWEIPSFMGYLGPANLRLTICGYCIAVIASGLALLFCIATYSPTPVAFPSSSAAMPLAIANNSTDTCRKIFHAMAVALFVPTIPLDPSFLSLAFACVLAGFLLLDIFRACQLPPIARPLTAFLAPYVDGRDKKGPAVVSHVFLLVGCAVPLWLSLAGMPRTGDTPWRGWEVISPTTADVYIEGTPRNSIAMVAGVVCVGLGDAAASVIGRRLGKRRWCWGGGKSMEGTLAFAGAVLLGLAGAKGLMRVYFGSGLTAWTWITFGATGARMAAAGGIAAMVEAVLTGGNDNVVVPVLLWLLVKGFGI